PRSLRRADSSSASLPGRFRRRRRQGRRLRGAGTGGRFHHAHRGQLHQRGGSAAGRNPGDAGRSRGGAAVEGLIRVRERIAAACARAGRAPDSVKLIAVSKTQPLEKLRVALDAGQRAFGENYAQELREKAEALGGGVEWHF